MRPMKLDNPIPNSTTPSPVTIWLTRSVMLISATTADITAPAAMATRMASHTLPVCTDVQNAATAPTSIIPSMPRFSTPERSAMISPMAARASGVPKRMPETMSVTTVESFTPPPPLRASRRPDVRPA